MILDVKNFIANEIGAHQFESNFLTHRRASIANNERWDSSLVSEAMGRIFSAIDRFYDGDEPDDLDIDEKELYKQVCFWMESIADLV